MEKVWVVCEGEYSSRSIVAVFSSQEKADAYVKAADTIKENSYSNCDIEEFMIDAAADHVFRHAHHCQIDLITGEIGHYSASGEMVPPGQRAKDPEVYISGLGSDFPGNPHASVTSYVSEDHAYKLAAESRQAWLREMAAQGYVWKPKGPGNASISLTQDTAAAETTKLKA